MTLDLGFAGFRMALNRASDAHKERLLPFLSPASLQKYHSLPKAQTRHFKDLPLAGIVDKMDVSWFFDPMRLFSTNDQMFYLSSFPEKTRTLLKEGLDLEGDIYDMPDTLKEFTLRLFFEAAFGSIDVYTPFSLLGEDSLLDLALASKKQLLLLCRYLGLYDLLHELKRVLQSSILKNLEKALTEDEITFLGAIQKERSLVHFMDIGLNHWDGNAAVLLDVLFKRGINRLAKALFSSSDALVWHISHALDKETAFALLDLRCDLKNPPMLMGLREQVFNTWKRICTTSLY